MRRGLVVVEHRQLAHAARNGHGQFPAGIHVAEQNIGNGVAALFAEVPALEHCVGRGGYLHRRGRTAVDQHDGDRLAKRMQGIEQRLLLTDQIQTVAVTQMGLGPALAAGLFGVADREHDPIGIARDRHRLVDQPPIRRRIRELDVVSPPVVVVGDLDALGIDDIGPRAHPGANAVQDRHLDRRFTVVASEAGDRGARADDRNDRFGATGRRQLQRQHAVVLQENDGPLRRLARQRARFRIVRERGSLPGIGIRVLEQSGAELKRLASAAPPC